LLAALHLALPRDTAVELQARIDADRLSWRGQKIELPVVLGPHISMLSKETLADDLLERLSPAFLPSDQFCDLSVEPFSWVKLITSGARHLAIGTDLLFGLPRLAFDAAPSPDEVDLVLFHLASARLETSTVLSAESRQLFVSGNGSSVLVSLAPSRHQPLAPASQSQIDELGLALAAELDGRLVEAIDLLDPSSNLAHVEYLIDLGEGTEALLAAHVDSFGAASVGYPGSWVPSRHAASWPPVPALSSWQLDGPASSEPGWVAHHQVSQLRALLRVTPQASPRQ